MRRLLGSIILWVFAENAVAQTTEGQNLTFMAIPPIPKESTVPPSGCKIKISIDVASGQAQDLSTALDFILVGSTVESKVFRQHARQWAQGETFSGVYSVLGCDGTVTAIEMRVKQSSVKLRFNNINLEILAPIEALYVGETEKDVIVGGKAYVTVPMIPVDKN